MKISNNVKKVIVYLILFCLIYIPQTIIDDKVKDENKKLGIFFLVLILCLLFMIFVACIMLVIESIKPDPIYIKEFYKSFLYTLKCKGS